MDDDKGPLGVKVDAPDEYAPHILFPIPRARGRHLLGLTDNNALPLPFVGEDVWNAYELSWLNGKGVPRRACLVLRIPCTTPFLTESKSLKLYLNSLSFKRFSSSDEMLKTIVLDVGRVLSGSEGKGAEEEEDAAAKASVSAELLAPGTEPPLLDASKWACVDDEDIGDLDESAFATPDASHIKVVDATSSTAAATEERVCSHLLRTLCPVTGQPDWGSVLVEYTMSSGSAIDRAGLLRYIVSLRREIGFHENAIERIFLAIKERCGSALDGLRVTGRFFRRGGIDINPVRAFGTVQEAEGATAQARVPGQ